MKQRYLSATTTLLTVLVFLALAAASSSRLVAAVEAAPRSATAETAATDKWNAVSMPLDATSAMPDAEALSLAIPGTQEVLRWNATQQRFDSWIPDAVFPPPGGFGTNFPIQVGQPYFVRVNSSAPATFTVVGDVPPQTGSPGAVQFSLLGDSDCRWNFITLPLDQAAVTNAEQLSLAIGTGANVRELLRWSGTEQRFDSWIPDLFFPPPGGFGTNFATAIGYPYFVCLNTDVTWP